MIFAQQIIYCLFFINAGARTSNVISSSASHGTNVFRAKKAFATKPSGSSKSLPDFPGTSRKLPKISNRSSKASSPASLRSSHSTDDTSELSGLSQLLSSQDVIKSGRHVSLFPSPSISTPHRHEVNSRHKGLATMLAELAGSSNRRVSPSVPSPNSPAISSSTWVAQMHSASINEQGKRSRGINFCLVIVSIINSHRRLSIYLKEISLT